MSVLDWEGNEIKEGMTIYFVQTKPGLFASSRMGLMIPQTGETIWEDEKNVEERRNKDVWELGMPYTVKEIEGRLFYTTEEDGEGRTFSFPLSYKKDSTIAIKGISDTKK